MGKHKHNYNPHPHNTTAPSRDSEVTSESLHIPAPIPPVADIAAEVEAALKVPEPKRKVWVVMEERRAALTGALVTVAKGKVVKDPELARRLIEQQVPIEERYI